MDVFSPLRLGWRVTTGAVGLATAATRTVVGEVLEHLPGVSSTPEPARPAPDQAAPPRATRPVATPPAFTPRSAETTAPPPRPAPRTAPAPEPEPALDVLDELSQQKTVDDSATLVETEGGASPGAQLHVDAPWDGYEQMKAADIVERLVLADAAEKAVVRLYEQQHKRRKSILAATG